MKMRAVKKQKVKKNNKKKNTKCTLAPPAARAEA